MSNARNISKAESRFVNASGDTLSGQLGMGTGSYISKSFPQDADEYIVDSGHGSWNPYMKYRASGGTGNRGFDIGAWNNNGTESSFVKFWNGDTLLNGAGQIGGAKLVARGGGLVSTNGSNESNGAIMFPCRIASGTNFVIATATNFGTYSMITASCHYVNIYDWSNSSIWSHGERFACIRGATTGTTSQGNYLDSYSTNTASGATYPSFYWTGTNPVNLNLTGAGSNEGICYVTIAWRDCTMSVNPST